MWISLEGRRSYPANVEMSTDLSDCRYEGSLTYVGVWAKFRALYFPVLQKGGVPWVSRRTVLVTSVA